MEQDSTSSEIENELNKSYTVLRMYLLNEAERSVLVLEKLHPGYLENICPPPLTPNEFYSYYKSLCSFSYIRKSGKNKIYSLNLNELDRLFEEISKDKRVYFFNKLSVLGFIQVLHEIRLSINLLNLYAPSIHKRGQQGNWVFPALKDAIRFKKKSKAVEYRKQVAQFAEEDFYLPIKRHIEQVIKIYSKNNTEDVNALKLEFLNIVEGDLRLLEKRFFPEFYKCLILKKDWESSGELGKPSPTKRDILFDIFPVIFPEKNLISSNNKTKSSRIGEKYKGSYYRYRIDTVKSICGK